MKRPALLLAACCAALSLHSAELFCYSAPDGTGGLRLAWRNTPSDVWTPINYSFLGSDFGPWGSHKKMFSPRLEVNASDSLWTATWEADPKGEVIALATSPDLIHWTPQRYFASRSDLPRNLRPLYPVTPDSAMIAGKMYKGWRQEVHDTLPELLEGYAKARAEKGAREAEQTSGDAERFAALRPVSMKVNVQAGAPKKISDKLIGIFFEDINYGADGGLYGELLQNRDFEYSPSDVRGWDSMTSWSVSGDGTATVDTAAPIHPNNPHYLRVDGGVELTNGGWDGITVKRGEKYDFSIAYRADKPVKAKVALVDSLGKKLGSAVVALKPSSGEEWAKTSAILRAGGSASGCRLVLSLPEGTRADLDMISLFPQATFKGRKNGLRADLAQTLADIHPKFVRFPGGCVAHGNGVDNIYDWKGSVGPLEARKPLRNLWHYHQTRGLGYHEYFQFCEDIGAAPLPVVAAGVPCQNSGIPASHSHDALTTYGQQCGIPFDQMDEYIQDILDLIEYANGDPAESKWAAMRAEAGHPEPFNLEYIGIGNEDLISEVFEERFRMIYRAVREKYPDIKVVGTAGPFYEGSDYEAGWALARKEGVDLVDEHYYVSPGWLIYNQDYYDNYDRSGPKVYLGEWAAHLGGRPNNLETALAEALYLTSVERNADVVEMTSYAPLLARRGHTQWRPDLIFFDNDSITLTPDYQVQKLYGRNPGTLYLPAEIEVADGGVKGVRERVGFSAVVDEKSGDTILRLVNMLPVEVKTDVSLPEGMASGRCKGWRMAGKPSQTDVVPVAVEASLPSITLPAYSFTLLRVSNGK